MNRINKDAGTYFWVFVQLQKWNLDENQFHIFQL